MILKIEAHFMRNLCRLWPFVFIALLLSSCGGSHSPATEAPAELVVTSLLDKEDSDDDVMTLRMAVDLIADGGTIHFAPDLDGETIELSTVGEEHTVLVGEVMGFDYENNISYLTGYFERDYGKSALYARKNLTIDASALPHGITLEWTGSELARVLAIYGNLTLNNVTITAGHSVAEEIAGYDPDAEPGTENSQPWTLARGGAVAVWGEAQLTNCTLYDNHCLGDFDQSRDRGAFGGGIYADIVHINNCVISGNTVVGAGAAGGGIYTVGGADHEGTTSTVEQSSITGNRISGLFTYGGGVYSDGGGIGQLKTLSITNSTIARNLVEPPLDHLPSFMLPSLLNMGYWRGGGVYMSNGQMEIYSSTIVENEVYGKPRTDTRAKPNLAGGIAATIGDAHTVESMIIAQSIIAANRVFTLDNSGVEDGSYANDIFTGSLLHFYSHGHNLIGQINFDHMLVPVPQWATLSRKHWPEEGDQSGIELVDVLDAPMTHNTIISQGTDEGEQVVLYYPAAGIAVDAVPDEGYTVTHTYGDILGFDYHFPNVIDGFLPAVLTTIEGKYGLDGFAEDFQTDFETYLTTVDTNDQMAGLQPYQDNKGNPILTLDETLWFGPIETWPSTEENQAWIAFWQRLDTALKNVLGTETLADDFWGDFTYMNTGDFVFYTTYESNVTVVKEKIDQNGTSRTGFGDIGAIELSGE